MYFSLICIVFLMNTATQVSSLEYDYPDTDDFHGHLQHEVIAPPVQIISNSLSLSKDWALRFDEELGRGDKISHDKKIELEDNMIRMAEILHFIPEGVASKRHETHIAHILDHHHPIPNPYTHIVVDPYKSVMLESSSASIANNDIEEPELDHINDKKSRTLPPTPSYSRPNIRARHPKFAMHGI